MNNSQFPRNLFRAALFLVCLKLYLPAVTLAQSQNVPVKEIKTINGDIAFFGTSLSVSDNFVFSTSVHQNLYLAANGVYYAALTGKTVSHPEIGLKIRNGANAGCLKIGQDKLSTDTLGSLQAFRISYKLGIPVVSPFFSVSGGADFGISTFFVKGNGFRKAFQYDHGSSFALNIFAVPFLPLGFSVQTEGEIITDFIPLVTWKEKRGIDPQASPFEVVIDSLKETYAGGKGNDLNAVINRKIAGDLIPLVRGLSESRMGEELKEFSKAPAGNSKIDTIINNVQDWANQGGDLSKSIPAGINEPPVHYSDDPNQGWSLGANINSVVNLSSETVIRRRCKETGTCEKVYADCIESLSCKPGEECKIEVNAQEIADLVPNSKASDFEGESLVFDQPYAGYKANVDDQGTIRNSELKQAVKDKVAQFSFMSLNAELASIGIIVPKSKKTGDKELHLCLRLVEQRPLVELVLAPESKDKDSKGNGTDKSSDKTSKGKPGEDKKKEKSNDKKSKRNTKLSISEVNKKGVAVKVRRTNTDLSKPLEVKYFLSGKAKAGKDYKKPSGKITIPAQKETGTIVIKLINNKLKQQDTTFKLNIEPQLDYGIVSDAGSVEITIINSK